MTIRTGEQVLLIFFLNNIFSSNACIIHWIKARQCGTDARGIYEAYYDYFFNIMIIVILSCDTRGEAVYVWREKVTIKMREIHPRDDDDETYNNNNKGSATCGEWWYAPPSTSSSQWPPPRPVLGSRGGAAVWPPTTRQACRHRSVCQI